MKSGSSPCAPRYFELTASRRRADLAARDHVATEDPDIRERAGVGAGKAAPAPASPAARRKLNDE